MAINQNELRQKLEEDFQESKSRVEKTSENLGALPRKDKLAFEPKGIRIKGQTLGAAELAENKRVMDAAIEHLVTEGQFASASEEASFRYDMTQKFNSLRSLVLEKGLNIEREVNRQKMKSNERAAILNAIGGTAQGIGQIAFYRSLANKSPSPSRGGQRSNSLVQSDPDRGGTGFSSDEEGAYTRMA